jgi:hypothetical protein
LGRYESPSHQELSEKRASIIESQISESESIFQKENDQKGRLFFQNIFQSVARLSSLKDRFLNKSIDLANTPRVIYINHEDERKQKFITNQISTAKYNPISFLPKFLYVEFSKSANLFFLFISGIQVKCPFFFQIKIWL